MRREATVPGARPHPDFVLDMCIRVSILRTPPNRLRSPSPVNNSFVSDGLTYAV